MRDFMNEGGRVLYTGQRAGQQYTSAVAGQLYDPFENRQCGSDPAIEARCLPLAGSGDGQGDPIEYWFGAAITTAGGGLDPDTGDPFDVAGIDDPLTGLGFGFNGADSAQNQTSDAAFIATTDYLQITDPAGSFPQFDSWPSAEYLSNARRTVRPAHRCEVHVVAARRRGVQAPHANDHCAGRRSNALVLDQLQARARLRLHDRRGAHRRPRQLDDAARRERAYQRRSEQRPGVPGGWSDPTDAEDLLHPFLTHYQTFDPDTGNCTSIGSSGEWNAANGSSSGWQQLEFDLGAFAGGQVEVSITALSDWGFQEFPGVFIDDIVVSTGEGSTSFEDDADPNDGWVPSGAPQDIDGIEGANANDWTNRGGLGIKEGAAISTPDSVYLGFGFEGITGADQRNELMGRAITYLLR